MANEVEPGAAARSSPERDTETAATAEMTPAAGEREAATPGEAHEPGGPAEAAGTAASPARYPAMLGRAEQRVAIGLIAIFMIFVVVLVVLRSDEHWDRLVFLLGGVEALVFAAAGALFGTSVQRTQAVEARQQAAQERQAATRERERADQFEQQARNGQALADVIRAKAAQAAGDQADGANAGEDGGASGPRRARPPGPIRAGVGPSAPGNGRDRDMAELAQMVNRWFPAGPGSDR
jgi:hypothetical protein